MSSGGINRSTRRRKAARRRRATGESGRSSGFDLVVTPAAWLPKVVSHAPPGGGHRRATAVTFTPQWHAHKGRPRPDGKKSREAKKNVPRRRRRRLCATPGRPSAAEPRARDGGVMVALVASGRTKVTQGQTRAWNRAVCRRRASRRRRSDRGTRHTPIIALADAPRDAARTYVTSQFD